MKKKIISLFMALSLIVVFTISSFAATYVTTSNSGWGSISYQKSSHTFRGQTGCTVTPYTAKIQNCVLYYLNTSGGTSKGFPENKTASNANATTYYYNVYGMLKNTTATHVVTAKGVTNSAVSYANSDML